MANGFKKDTIILDTSGHEFSGLLNKCFFSLVIYCRARFTNLQFSFFSLKLWDLNFTKL